MFKKNKKERYKKFKPIPREILLQKTIDFLKAKENPKDEIKIHISILERLQQVFKNNVNADDQTIYNTVREITKNLDRNYLLDKKLSSNIFITRYSKNEQYDILPDVMQSDFHDIPDENGMSKYEVVETIQRFGEILNNITTKEKDLNSKLDCSLYAEQYLDTLEQIATLYRRRVIPKKATDYFENKFAYGINLFNWYSKFVNKKSLKIFNPSDEEFDSQNEKEERWTDFKWFCRGGDAWENKITEFKDDEKKDDVLPSVMNYYDDLPDEEGIKPSEVLEIMRNYSKQLTDISGREPELKTQIDCSVYAEQYLDILEQIAYLFNNRSLVTDANTYFENNFTYGLTLKKWYTLAVNGADAQENRWIEFDNYCKKFKDKYGRKMSPFAIESVLPPSMLNYQNLPTDQCGDKNKNKINYKRKE